MRRAGTYMELQLRKNVHIRGSVFQRNYWRMVGHVPRHTEEFHNIIIQEYVYDRKMGTRGPQNSYTVHIKNDASGKTLKEKMTIQLEF